MRVDSSGHLFLEYPSRWKVRSSEIARCQGQEGDFSLDFGVAIGRESRNVCSIDLWQTRSKWAVPNPLPKPISMYIWQSSGIELGQGAMKSDQLFDRVRIALRLAFSSSEMLCPTDRLLYLHHHALREMLELFGVSEHIHRYRVE
jgi:hypothetical protein